MTAGQVYLYHFYLAYPLTINTIYTGINVSGTAGHLGVGIYTEAGNLQTSATILLTGFGVQTSSPTQVTLSPGWYYYAITIDSVTGSPAVEACLTTIDSLDTTLAVRLWARATNTSTNGVLPATTGTLLANNLSNMNVPRAVFSQ